MDKYLEMMPTSCHAVFVIFIASAVQRGTPCMYKCKYLATHVKTQSVFEIFSFVFHTMLFTYQSRLEVCIHALGRVGPAP